MCMYYTCMLILFFLRRMADGRLRRLERNLEGAGRRDGRRTPRGGRRHSAAGLSRRGLSLLGPGTEARLLVSRGRDRRSGEDLPGSRALDDLT